MNCVNEVKYIYDRVIEQKNGVKHFSPSWLQKTPIKLRWEKVRQKEYTALTAKQKVDRSLHIPFVLLPDLDEIFKEQWHDV